MDENYDKAMKLAVHAHADQQRDDGTPYVTHLIRVAGNFRDGDVNKTIAVLHDILEDTQVSESQLRELFGDFITEQVLLLTHVRHESYAKYLERLSNSPSARAVKIADLKDNLSDCKIGSRRDKYELALLYLQQRRWEQ